MRGIRYVCLLSLFFAVALFVHNASATLVLPDSSYAEAVGNWQGHRIYEEDDFFVRIDFAVYDTENLTKPGETELVEELETPGQFIYAYQIFNHRQNSDANVGFFEVFGLGEPVLDVYVDSIGALSDSDNPNLEGMEPSSSYFNPSHSRGTWVFSENDEHTPLYPGEHSWFLCFSSNSAPVQGDYEIRVPEVDLPVPPPEIPEPTMVTLLCVGSALMFISRKRSV
jgi:hypothetical protein